MKAECEHDLQQMRLLAAIDLGCARYFNQCRARVPVFVVHHFRYPGAWHTNRRALGWDMLRAPLNLLWAPFYFSFQCLAWLLQKARLGLPASLMRMLPSGLRTQIQTYLIERTEVELMQCGSADSSLRACIAEAIVE